MNTYLLHFAVYSFAMVGFIGIALFVYKKSMYMSVNSSEKNFLKVENTLKLTPVKTLYVIKAGNEKFLIAGDSSTTTMLSKLEKNCDDIAFESSKKHEGISDISSLKSFTKRISRG